MLNQEMQNAINGSINEEQSQVQAGQQAQTEQQAQPEQQAQS